MRRYLRIHSGSMCRISDARSQLRIVADFATTLSLRKRDIAGLHGVPLPSDVRRGHTAIMNGHYHVKLNIFLIDDAADARSPEYRCRASRGRIGKHRRLGREGHGHRTLPAFRFIEAVPAPRPIHCPRLSGTLRPALGVRPVRGRSLRRGNRKERRRTTRRFGYPDRTSAEKRVTAGRLRRARSRSAVAHAAIGIGRRTFAWIESRGAVIPFRHRADDAQV